MREPLIRKELVRSSFILFWWYYFEHYHYGKIPDYHLESMAHAKAARLLSIEPRDHGKSVRWSCAFPLWVGLTNPFNRTIETLPGGGFRYKMGQEEIVCQISHSGGLPQRWIRRHKRELTYNHRLIADWGEQSTEGISGGSWTKEDILLANGAHIYSKGSGAQIRGDHPTQVVVDDLEDREECKNPDLRDKTTEYFFADVYGALEPSSQLKVVGTIVHPQSLLNDLWQKEIIPAVKMQPVQKASEQWVKFKYRAILPDGSPLMPEKWTMNALTTRRETLYQLGLGRLWKSEYMNEPEVSESPVFPTTWFEKDNCSYDVGDAAFRESTIPGLKRISFCDPNVGQKETDDWTAIVTLGYRIDRNPVVYVLEAKQFRASFRQKVQEAVNTWKKWRGKIGFEGIQFQSVLAEEFGRVCREEHLSPDYFTTVYKDRPIKGEPVPKVLDKVTRAERVQVFFEMGWVKFNFRDPNQVILMEQLQNFPDAQHDDLVDAIVGALWEIKGLWNRVLEEKKQSVNIRYDPETGQPSYIFEDDRLPSLEV